MKRRLAAGVLYFMRFVPRSQKVTAKHPRWMWYAGGEKAEWRSV